MLVNGEAYSYARMRAPGLEPGRVASHSWLANGQFSGEVVPMPGTRTMLGLRVSGSTELGLIEFLLLKTILRSTNGVPKFVEAASSCKARRCGHD